MRRAERYRKTMLELSDRPDQQLSFTHITWDNIPEQASNLRQQLGLSESFAPKYSQPQQVFTFWRNLLESWGFLVFQTTKISLSPFRPFTTKNYLLSWLMAPIARMARYLHSFMSLLMWPIEPVVFVRYRKILMKKLLPIGLPQIS